MQKNWMQKNFHEDAAHEIGHDRRAGEQGRKSTTGTAERIISVFKIKDPGAKTETDTEWV